MKLSIVLPSFARRELTERAVRSVFAQAETFTGAEVFFLGDGCAIYDELVRADWFQQGCLAVAGQITFMLGNSPQRDGTPAPIVNKAIAAATGEYFTFMANDDRLLPGHFRAYYHFAKEQDADLAYFDSLIEIDALQSVRNAGLAYGHVGHAEICVRTELARSVPPHHRGYGHDWDFIRSIQAVARPDKILKAPNPPWTPTYVVNMGPREHTYQNGTT